MINGSSERATFVVVVALLLLLVVVVVVVVRAFVCLSGVCLFVFWSCLYSSLQYSNSGHERAEDYLHS